MRSAPPQASANVINANPGLKVVATVAIWPNTVDLGATTARGIPVTCIPNMVVEATADATLGLSPLSLRRAVGLERGLRSSQRLSPASNLLSSAPEPLP